MSNLASFILESWLDEADSSQNTTPWAPIETLPVRQQQPQAHLCAARFRALAIHRQLFNVKRSASTVQRHPFNVMRW